MKNDPERGAEDIETFGMLCQALGSVLYCVIGGLIMRGTEDETTPKSVFLITACVGVAIFLVALIYPKESEVKKVLPN
jgi:surface polysaccharide O-acyltransferase-like enzyme